MKSFLSKETGINYLLVVSGVMAHNTCEDKVCDIVNMLPEEMCSLWGGATE